MKTKLLTLVALCLMACEADNMYTSQPCNFVFFASLYPSSALTRAVGSAGGDFCIVESTVRSGVTHLLLTPNRGTYAATDLDLTMNTAITGEQLNYASMGINRGLIIGRSLYAGLRAYDLQCPNCIDEKGGTRYPLAWVDGQPQDIACPSCHRVYNLDGEYGYVKSGAKGRALIQYKSVSYSEQNGRLVVRN